MAEKMTFEKAKDILFNQKFHCSQCVMYHTAEDYGLDRDLALRLSAGLGGGCFHGDVCGTVSAAVLTLGLVYGFDKPNSTEENALMVEKLQEFENRFIEKNGSIVCRELLGGSFTDPEIAKSMACKCPQFCVDACDILDDMLKDVKKA